jgi:6-pyruvoyltetrahydropterin/6-carboxytetrahydropterin synthase
MRLSSEFHYDSAHYLPMVPPGHKCGRMHGHTYHLTVTLDGPVREDGFVIDFADVKTAIAPLIEQLDHHLINDVIDNPTVENQLLWLWDRIDLPLHELSLREGEKNTATYRGEAQ